MSINKAFISGNLVKDAELRQTRGGMEIATFTVAVNERRKNADGEWADCVNYLDCTMFGTRAGKIAGYLVKGTKVSIEGKLRWSQWEKDGQKRSKVEIVVDEIEFMQRREGAQDGGYRQQGNYAGNGQTRPYGASREPQGGAYGQYAYGTQQQLVDGPSQASVYDSDIPF